MSKSTFKILFYLRKNYVNKEGKASIMIRITAVSYTHLTLPTNSLV